MESIRIFAICWRFPLTVSLCNVPKTLKNSLASPLLVKRFAGHSKWHNIRHKKGAEDAKRCALFTSIGLQLKEALNQGGNSPSNVRLQAALAKAKELSVPRDVVDRAIARAEQAKAGGMTRYECVGPCGISFIITCITDNKARTAQHIRNVCNKHGAIFSSTNAVAFRFKKVGQLEFAGIDPSRRNDLMDAAITAGAEDIVDKSDNQIAVVCAPEEFAEVKTALKDSGFEASSGDIVFVPVNQVDISQDEYDQVFSFIQELEALDDVEDISHDAA